MLELVILFCISQADYCEEEVYKCISTGTSIEWCIGDYVLNEVD